MGEQTNWESAFFAQQKIIEALLQEITNIRLELQETFNLVSSHQLAREEGIKHTLTVILEGIKGLELEILKNKNREEQK